MIAIFELSRSGVSSSTCVLVGSVNTVSIVMDACSQIMHVYSSNVSVLILTFCHSLILSYESVPLT